MEMLLEMAVNILAALIICATSGLISSLKYIWDLSSVDTIVHVCVQHKRCVAAHTPCATQVVSSILPTSIFAK